MHPSLSLPRADHVFSKEETDMLVWEARRSRWTELLNLDDFALRKRYCIGGEADWYLDLLRQSARFVHDYGETADGIGRRAIEF
jgi:hypothetical protein